MKMHLRFSFLFSPSVRFLLLGLLIGLAACSSSGLEIDKKYEVRDKERLYKNGSVVRDEGGFSLFGGDDKKSVDGSGLGVNGFLWRAALDTLAFMPIATADPFGGVITTDWHSESDTPNERLKLNVFILDRDLRADGVRVAVFRQVRGKDGSWNAAPVAAATASSLEETILMRARQLRLAQKEQKQ